MRELEIAWDQLNTIQRLVDAKPGLEMLHYLVAMAMREAEDKLKIVKQQPRDSH